MKRKLISLGLLFLTAIIWGFAFVAQIQGMDHVEPFTLIGTRFLIAIIVLLPVLFIFEKGRTGKQEQKRTFVSALIAGVLLFSASSVQQFGIQIQGSAGVAGFITGLYTVFVPIACYLFFKQKTSLGTYLGAICAVIGLFLLCYKTGEGLYFGKGELLLLIGSFLWTAHVIAIDRLGKHVRSIHLAWGQFAVCAVLGFIFMFVFETPSVSSVIDARWSILYCGVMSSGVAYTLQVVAQKRSDPTVAAIVLSTESVFSAIGGLIFGIDDISLLGYLGCALMFVGIVASQLDPSFVSRLIGRNKEGRNV